MYILEGMIINNRVSYAEDATMWRRTAVATTKHGKVDATAFTVLLAQCPWPSVRLLKVGGGRAHAQISGLRLGDDLDPVHYKTAFFLPLPPFPLTRCPPPTNRSSQPDATTPTRAVGSNSIQGES